MPDNDLKKFYATTRKIPLDFFDNDYYLNIRSNYQFILKGELYGRKSLFVTD
jgi:hypothetical protein